MTIDKNTVLVLGAGASKPYGYPLGGELKDKLVSEYHFAQLTNNGAYPSEVISRFCQTFMRSGMPSIDAFLARRGRENLYRGMTIEEIGKAGISLAIRKGVTYESLFQKRELGASPAGEFIDWEDDWYSYLWRALTNGIKPSNIEDFKKHQLSVITFNYDHSLEHYLYTAMRNAYSVTEAQATDLLSAIQIVHVYGSLSGNPFSDSYPYSFDWSRYGHWVAKDIQGIIVIDEDRETSTATFDRAYTLLESAQQICFLGFGFDSTNVARLKLPELMTKHAFEAGKKAGAGWPNWVFSTMGLYDAERKTLARDLTAHGKNNQALMRDVMASHLLNRIEDRIFDFCNQKTLATLRSSQVLVA